MTRFARFILVGITNTIIGLSIIFVLYNLLQIDYRLSNLIGYIIALINSFILNKTWTFGSKDKSYREPTLFLTVFVFCYLANILIVILLVEYIRMDKNISQLFGIATYTLLNYIGNARLTFAVHKQ